MPRNIFVLGLDELNLGSLQTLPDADDLRFHRLLTIEELQQREEIRLEELVDKATRQLEAFEGRVDAIVGYWDFPISSMVPILAQTFGTLAASLESVVKCEHKYWARLEQCKAIDECPRFALVDPFEEASRIDLVYPYWLKPVKSFSSALAYRIDGPEALGPALEDIRENVSRIGEPFDQVLSRLELPEEIARVGGEACIAEEEAGGQQVTVEGYSDGRVVAHGVVDSVTYPDASSFERFQYPSQMPQATQDRLCGLAERVIEQLGLRHSTFNIEFFWDPATEDVSVLEVNPRHSQSHAKLFEFVDGVPNHKVMVDLALGREPELVHGNGPYRMAAKWFLRRFADGRVTRSPTSEEVAEIERQVPGTAIHVVAEQGARLSEMHDQDSYSYKLANIYAGADSEDELREKYDRCVERLAFAFADEG